MDQVYALGVSCIELIQYWFEDWENYFEMVNHFSNPRYVMQYMFPFVSIFDSVFGSQLLMVMSFGGWVNSIMKWMFFEDRPYWWVRETTFYSDSERPDLFQTAQSCETGPGSPSGHSTTAASVLILLLMWVSHIINDRKWNIWWWKCCMYPLVGAALGSVMLARMYIATHFPHQCLLGGLIGSFLAPALCIYITDPFIWQYGPHANTSVKATVYWHVFSAAVTMTISAATYIGLKLCGIEPHHTVKLAFRWCEQPETIHVGTTPLFALTQASAALLGAALCITPTVARYRHYSQNRSILIAIFATVFFMYLFRKLEDNICKDNAFVFYAMHFALNVAKPMVLLRIVPELATWPYKEAKVKTN